MGRNTCINGTYFKFSSYLSDKLKSRLYVACLLVLNLVLVMGAVYFDVAPLFLV